jgi:chaperonin GroES
MALPLVDRTGVPLPAGMEDVSLEAPIEEDLEVELPPEEGEDEIEAEEEPAVDASDPDANLALVMDESSLAALASDLLERIEDDIKAREEWLQGVTRGLTLLGIEEENREFPFEDAAGVYHPLLSEAVVQFASNAYKELLPPEGPVRTKVLGAKTPEKLARATRVRQFMNHLLMDRMEEFETDTDNMLFHLGLAGSEFKKVFKDRYLGRPVSLFVPAEDLIVPYGATSLATAPRITHRVKLLHTDILADQDAGVYRMFPLSDPQPVNQDDLQEKKDELAGLTQSMVPDYRSVYEVHLRLDLSDFDPLVDQGQMAPYIVLIDVESAQVLSAIRAAVTPTPTGELVAEPMFVHYKLMPGTGFYGFGLAHLIGNLSSASTSLLRQLIDSGTLANLQGGFKARGVKVRDPDVPIAPGEFRDVDVAGGNVRDAILPLPYKEPSATLVTLLGSLVTDGRRFISLVDENLQNPNNEAPVGTTVAMLERGLKVLSAIHKRLHHSQKIELRLLRNIIARDLPPVYPYEPVDGTPEIKAEDFGPDIDVIPVSDPNIFSMAQRVTLAQTQLQLAQSAPEIHDLREAYRRMYVALDVEDVDAILPKPQEPQPMDPALENGMLIHTQVPQPFPQQDHMAHITAHLSLYQLWLVNSTPPIQGAIAVHVLQHVSFLAREMVDQQMSEQKRGYGEDLAGLAVAGQLPPDQAEQMAMGIGEGNLGMDEDGVEKLVAQTVASLMQEIGPQISPKPMDDPLVEIRRRELDVQEQEVMIKAQTDGMKQQLDMLRLAQKDAADSRRSDLVESAARDRAAVNRERIQSQEEAHRDRMEIERMRLQQQELRSQQQLLQQRMLEMQRIALQRRALETRGRNQ